MSTVMENKFFKPTGKDKYTYKFRIPQNCNGGGKITSNFNIKVKRQKH